MRDVTRILLIMGLVALVGCENNRGFKTGDKVIFKHKCRGYYSSNIVAEKSNKEYTIGDVCGNHIHVLVSGRAVAFHNTCFAYPTKEQKPQKPTEYTEITLLSSGDSVIATKNCKSLLGEFVEKGTVLEIEHVSIGYNSLFFKEATGQFPAECFSKVVKAPDSPALSKFAVITEYHEFLSVCLEHGKVFKHVEKPVVETDKLLCQGLGKTELVNELRIVEKYRSVK